MPHPKRLLFHLLNDKLPRFESHCLLHSFSSFCLHPFFLEIIKDLIRQGQSPMISLKAFRNTNLINCHERLDGSCPKVNLFFFNISFVSFGLLLSSDVQSPTSVFIHLILYSSTVCIWMTAQSGQKYDKALPYGNISIYVDTFFEWSSLMQSLKDKN